VRAKKENLECNYKGRRRCRNPQVVLTPLKKGGYFASFYADLSKFFFWGQDLFFSKEKGLRGEAPFLLEKEKVLHAKLYKFSNKQKFHAISRFTAIPDFGLFSRFRCPGGRKHIRFKEKGSA